MSFYSYLAIDASESEGRTIVYLDESGFTQNVPRQHGYFYRGKRCHGVHDWYAKGRIHVIGCHGGLCLSRCWAILKQH